MGVARSCTYLAVGVQSSNKVRAQPTTRKARMNEMGQDSRVSRFQEAALSLSPPAHMHSCLDAPLRLDVLIWAGMDVRAIGFATYLIFFSSELAQMQS